MKCSDCNKNDAVVFIDIDDNKGNKQKIGYCFTCAKKRGINPVGSGFNNIKNLSDEDIKNMTTQLNNMLKDISSNVNFQGITSTKEFRKSEENNIWNNSRMLRSTKTKDFDKVHLLKEVEK